MCKECESEHKHYTCECGKSFERLNQMTGHQAKCKVHKAILESEREAKRLPNGLFKCENPDCNNEHDGSYGSGKFCSKKCRMHVIGKRSYETRVKNGTFTSYFSSEDSKIKRHAKCDWKCSSCGKIFRTRRLMQEHYREEHYNGKCKNAWNKGLTKESSEKVASMSKKVSEGVRKCFREGTLTGKCKDPTKEELRRKKISESMKNNHKCGGKRQGSGRGKKGWYKGIWCDSSWELAVVVYWIEHGIKFERCVETFKYSFNNELHVYHPDFKLNTGEYVEVKGYSSKQWEAKLNAFPIDRKIIVIDKLEIKPYIKYVSDKYGRNFTSLYEKESFQ